MRASSLAIGTVALSLVAATAACGAIVGLGSYRDCVGIECACEGGACSDDGASGTDASPDAPSVGCTTVDDCRAVDSTYAMCTAAGTCRKVKAIARGSSQHLCALLDQGEVVCWGNNDHAQLGTGQVSPYRKEPRVVAGIPPMQSVGVGISFSCALSKSGQVYCWGEVGTGLAPIAPTQVNLPPSRQARELSVGQADACALLDDQSIYCWGDDLWGQDGCADPEGLCSNQDGGTASPKPAFIESPRQLSDGGVNYDRIAVGVFQTCAAVKSTGQTHCWGVKDHLGVDPNAAYVCCSQSDLTATNGGELQDLVSTEFYACRKDDVGEFDCWGTNISCAFASNCGQEYVPIALAGISPGDTIAAGWHHLCWIHAADGSVYCRGEAQYSALGDGTPGGFYSVTTPSKVKGLTAPVADLASNRFFNCAVQTDGRVMCWGGFGQWLLGVDGVVNGPDIHQATPVNWGNP